MTVLTPPYNKACCCKTYQKSLKSHFYWWGHDFFSLFASDYLIFTKQVSDWETSDFSGHKFAYQVALPCLLNSISMKLCVFFSSSLLLLMLQALFLFVCVWLFNIHQASFWLENFWFFWATSLLIKLPFLVFWTQSQWSFVYFFLVPFSSWCSKLLQMQLILSANSRFRKMQ